MEAHCEYLPSRKRGRPPKAESERNAFALMVSAKRRTKRRTSDWSGQSYADEHASSEWQSQGMWSANVTFYLLTHSDWPAQMRHLTISSSCTSRRWPIPRRHPRSLPPFHRLRHRRRCPRATSRAQTKRSIFLGSFWSSFSTSERTGSAEGDPLPAGQLPELDESRGAAGAGDDEEHDGHLHAPHGQPEGLATGFAALLPREQHPHQLVGRRVLLQPFRGVTVERKLLQQLATNELPLPRRRDRLLPRFSQLAVRGDPSHPVGLAPPRSLSLPPLRRPSALQPLHTYLPNVKSFLNKKT